MLLLLIESSAETCSVAICEEGMLMWQQIEEEPMKHSERLAPLVAQALREVNRHEKKLDGVAVSLGPGSYTGLRIGLSEAKGICFGLDIPLIGIETLKTLAVKAMFQSFDWSGDEILIPMIDARRMEVYTAAYDFALNELMKPQPLILEHDSYENISKTKPLYLFGSGAQKAKNVLDAPNIHFMDIQPLLACDMIALAEKYFKENKFIDVAYSTPTYLKGVHITKPKSRI